jgi:hypothetical protein
MLIGEEKYSKGIKRHVKCRDVNPRLSCKFIILENGLQLQL